MADLMTYDLNGLLTEEEQKKLFEEPESTETEETEVEELEETETEVEEPAEEPEQDDEQEPEEVGGDNNIEKGEDTGTKHEPGSSPSVYPSIARAFRTDGIFPDFDDSELEAATTAEAFAELVNKAIESKVTAQLDERTNRVNEALSNGVAPDEVRNCEVTIEYLNSLDEDAITDESEKGEMLRRKLIYNDMLLHGYTEDEAKRGVEKSFKLESDVDDAKDALDALKSHWTNKYDTLRKDARERTEKQKKEQKKQLDSFKKMLLEDEVKIGETKIDKKSCQRAYDAVMTPTYKDPDTGMYLTEVQKFQKENPLEFMKLLGLWFTLTDGGKTLEGVTRREVNKAKNKGIRELEQKIQASSLHADGSLNLVGGSGTGSSDPLLSDGWNVGWAK